MLKLSRQKTSVLSKRSVICLFVLIMGLSCPIAFSGENLEQNTIAVVGKRRLTMNDLKEALLRKFQSPARIDTLSPVEKEKCLTELVDRTLILNEAYRTKVYNEKSLAEKVQQFREEALTNALIGRAVVDSILTEERLMQFYEKYGGEIRLRQILIPTPGSLLWSEPKDSLADKQPTELPEKLYTALLSGKDFAAIAREHSQDMNTASKGGDLGYVRWGQLTKEVQDVAFTLPVGTVSRPIRSGLGYHIIQVVDKKKRSFEEEKGTIKYQLAATYGRTIESRQDDFLNALTKHYRVTLHYSNIERLINLIGPHYAPFSNLKQKDKNIVLASFVGGIITVADLVQQVGDASVNYRWDEQNIEQWIGRLTLKAITVEEAISQKIDVSTDVLRFKEELMVELLTERQLDDRMTISEAELREYFKQHKDQFQSPAMVRVQEILLKERYLAESVASRAKRGENFEQLVQEQSLRPESRAKGGDLGYVTREQQQEIFDAAVDRNVGEIYGPFQVLEGFSIIKILGHRPAQAQTFEEARTKLNFLVGDKKRRTLYTQWITELRHRYRTEIRREVLDSAVLSKN